jgi:galactose oxidase
MLQAYLLSFLAFAVLVDHVAATPTRFARKRQTIPANLTPISSCPNGNNGTIIVNNLGYNLCTFSQYNVPSQQWPVVANDTACAGLCSTTNGCTTAVFDRQGKNCHIKGNPSASANNWVYDNRFDAINLAYTPTQGADLTSCPFGGYSYTASTGAVYDVCPMADYPVYSYQVIPNVANATSCAAMCTASNNNCANAVYDAIYSYCHIKGTLASNAPWKVNTQFMTIKMRIPLAVTTTTTTTTTSSFPTSTSTSSSSTAATATSTQLTNLTPLTTCPLGNNQTVITNNLGYNVCQFAQYNIPSQQWPIVANDTACASLCSSTNGCTTAVFDRAGGNCHIKGSPAANAQNLVYDNRFDAIQLAYTPTQGADITGCPFGGYIFTSTTGAVYDVCPMTDYPTQSFEVIPNVNSATLCAAMCTIAYNNCQNAVYDHQYQYCHIKGTLTAGSPWQVNTQFDTIKLRTPAPNTGSTNSTLSKLGQWSAVISTDVIAVAAYLVPAFPVVQQFMAFASWSPVTFGGAAAYSTAFQTYDIASGAQGPFSVANTQHDMFCPGINSLADGRLVINGGDTDQAVTIYDPFANTFTRAANMTTGRGYQSSVTLSDGRAFTIGGSFTGGIGGENGVPLKNGEVYDPAANVWTALPGATVQQMLTTFDNAGAWRTDNHAWLYAWTGGSVLQAGPSKQMNWYSTTGQGGVQAAGTRNANDDQMCGVNVMYETGKIFATGGAQSYNDNNSLNVAHTITINGVNVAPTVKQVASMNYARTFANAIVLPNGNVFITGGQTYAAVFSDSASVLSPEIYDPVKDTFTVLAPASVPRNYHSTALLLPDGRVMSGGGGLCYIGGGCNNANHQDMQFYSPPYLFDANGNAAVRPTVTSLKSSQQSGQRVQVIPGGTLTVTLKSVKGLNHALVRMGSSTHSVDTDQRRISLTVQKTSGNTVTLAVPNDNGVVPPGYWYYFAYAPSGIHSVGMTVNVLKK